MPNAEKVILLDGSGAEIGDANPLPVELISGGGVLGPTAIARLVSAAATTNATVVKNAAGRLYEFTGYNAAGAVRYLKFYNKATAPTVGTDIPILTFALPPGAGFVVELSAYGYAFSTGISYATTTGSADNDSAAVTLADIVGLNIFYT